MTMEVNYASSKAGVLGFTRTLAQEVEEYGITVNAVMPMAATRLLDAALKARGGSVTDTASTARARTPESNTPLILYLAIEGANNITGCTFASRIEGTIQLMSNPSAMSSIYKEGMWTIDELSKVMHVVLMA